jgi:hypothetical protein
MADATALAKVLDRAQREAAEAPRRLAHAMLEVGAGLSRVWSYLNDPKRFNSFGVLSAMRDAGNPARRADNQARHKSLQRDVRALGLGFIPAVGRWVENAGTPDAREVVELSLIVPNLRLEDLIRLLRKYEQEAGIWGSGGKVRAYDQQGRATEWSQWSRMRFQLDPGAVQSLVKGRRAFAFEALRPGIREGAPSFSVKGREFFLEVGEPTAVEYEEVRTGWRYEDLRPGQTIWWQSRGAAPAWGLLRVHDVTPVSAGVSPLGAAERYRLTRADCRRVSVVVP